MSVLEFFKNYYRESRSYKYKTWAWAVAFIFAVIGTVILW